MEKKQSMKKPFQIYLLEQEKDGLKKAAEAKGVTQTELARGLIVKFLNRTGKQ